MNKSDIFSIIDYPEEGKLYGSYKGKFPGQAAKKVLSFLANKANINNNANKKKRFVVFTIINNRTKKEYKFIGTRIRMNKPKIVNIGSKEIKYYYKNIVTRYEKYYNKMNE